MSKKIGLVLCLVAVCGAASAQTYTADHIEVKMDPDRDPLSLNHFQLTDNPENSVGADSGTLVVTEQKTGLLSGGVTEAYDTSVGSTVGPFSGSLSPLVGSLSSSRAGFVSGDDKVQRVESVVNQNFIDEITRNDGKYNLMAASGYEPKGQVISAYETPKREKKQLHLCTQDAPEDVVFSDSRPYKCDTKGQNGDGLWRTINDKFGPESGDWDPVPRCQDGYDNDGDDYKDFPADNGCSSERDDTETVGEETQTCDPFIGEQDGNKVAFYDSGQGSSNPLGNGCNYEVQETVDGTDVLETFRCTQQGDAKSAGGGNLGLANNVERAARDFCTAVGNRDNHLHSGSEVQETEAVRSVIFSYTKDNIPYSPKAENQGVSTSKTSPRANEFVEDTDFSPSTLKKRCARKTQTPGTDSIGGGDLVYEGGFTLRRCETVHHAENEYTNGDPHAASVWRSRGMADLGDGYERSDSSLEPIDIDRADSWVAAQPGGGSDGVEIQGDTVLDPEFFEGGFAGRCPGSGKWQYVTPSGPLYNTIDSSGIWRCGNPSQISVDFFKLNVRDYGEKHVGFRVTKEQVSQWKSTFSGLPGTPELKMDAACWPGRRNTLVDADDSVNANLLTNITVDLNTNADTIAGLELKDPNLPADRYSCVYGFRQTNVNKGSLIPNNEDSFFNGLLVEGVRNKGSITSTGVEVDLNTDIERVRRPDIPDDAMESGDVREQKFLESYNATNNNRVSTVSEPFKDYPSAGSDSSDTFGGAQVSTRNPLESYLSQS